MIEIQHLEKTFKVLNRKEGIKGAFMDLFSKDYNYVKAVNDISLNINKGEIVGYLGPNGAGKSTTIKMMTGILSPSSGKIFISGMEPYENRRKHLQNIGVVFGQRSQLWWSLPVIESYKVLKEIYKVDDKVYKRNMELFENLVDIKSLYGKPVRQLSLGQRMLCEVIAAFLHDPKVVFLDEPTIGLDVAIKDKIRGIIKHLNEEKKTTIVLTSHDTSDIETLCERAVIIDKGALIFDNTINKLKQMFGRYRTLKINTGTESDQKEIISKLLEKEFNKDEYTIDEEDGNMLPIIINEQKLPLTKVLNYILTNLDLKDIQIEDVGVESVIKKIYEG